jgi:hypothetical protein
MYLLTIGYLKEDWIEVIRHWRSSLNGVVASLIPGFLNLREFSFLTPDHFTLGCNGDKINYSFTDIWVEYLVKEKILLLYTRFVQAWCNYTVVSKTRELLIFLFGFSIWLGLRGKTLRPQYTSSYDSTFTEVLFQDTTMGN